MAARVRDRVRDVLAWRDVRALLALFCFAQLLDGVTTYIALTSHHFEEANPIFGSLLDAHPLVALGVKLLVASVVVVAVLALRIRWRLRLAVIVVFTAASLVAPMVNISRLTGL